MSWKTFLINIFSPLLNRFLAIYNAHKCNNHVSNSSILSQFNPHNFLTPHK